MRHTSFALCRSNELDIAVSITSLHADILPDKLLSNNLTCLYVFDDFQNRILLSVILWIFQNAGA